MADLLCTFTLFAPAAAAESASFSQSHFISGTCPTLPTQLQVATECREAIGPAADAYFQVSTLAWMRLATVHAATWVSSCHYGLPTQHRRGSCSSLGGQLRDPQHTYSSTSPSTPTFPNRPPRSCAWRATLVAACRQLLCSATAPSAPHRFSWWVQLEHLCASSRAAHLSEEAAMQAAHAGLAAV